MSGQSSGCGTYAGAVQHKKRREKPCDQCATAVAAYAVARGLFRIGQVHDPDRCRDCGSVFITDHNCPLDAR